MSENAQADWPIDAEPEAGVRRVPAATGRRFAVFAGILFLAHLALPWFAVRGHGVEADELRPRFWWTLLSDHRLPEPVSFQIVWMGISLVCLAVVSRTRSRRTRALLLIAVGTVGLLLAGWGTFNRWIGSRAGLADLSQLFVLLAVGVLVTAALQAAELRASIVSSGGQAHRGSLALLGLVNLPLAAVTAALLPAAGNIVYLVGGLLPRTSSISQLVPGMSLLLVLGGVALASLLCIATWMSPGRLAGAIPRLARWSIQLPILLMPIVTALFASGSPAARAGRIVPAQYLQARLVGIYALYWFALSIGGEVMLTAEMEAQEDEERF